MNESTYKRARAALADWVEALQKLNKARAEADAAFASFQEQPDFDRSEALMKAMLGVRVYWADNGRARAKYLCLYAQLAEEQEQ